MNSYTPPSIPWYKTRAGKIFVGIISAIGVIAIGIGALAGYYAWQIAQGNGDDLDKLFNKNELSTDPRLAARSQVAADVNSMIRPFNPALGAKDAPVTLVAFIDFECPFSQRSYSTVKTALEHYDPTVRIVFKHLPLTSIHPNAMPAAHASLCAHEQEAFWPYYSLLFEHKTLDTDSLQKFAKQLGLNQQQFNTCLSSEKYKSQIEQDIQDGINLGVQGTPTYFINNEKIQGNIERSVWDEVIIDHIKTSS